MPESATITAFYSFTASTKARATQVNNNFDVFRGHLLPIDPNTQTAINNTYDLGSSEYAWKNAYLGGWQLTNNTTTGLGDLVFKKNGSEKYIVSESAGNGYTSTAAPGQVAGAVISTQTITGSNVTVTSSSMSIQTIGRPVKIGLSPLPNPAFSNFYLQLETYATVSSQDIVLRYIIDGTIGATYNFQYQPATNTSAVIQPSARLQFTPPEILLFLSAGSHTLSLRVDSLGTNRGLYTQGVLFYAIEL